MPDEIGASRNIVIGKHSGKHAVWDKLKKLGIETEKDDLLEIVELVKSQSANRKSAINNKELVEIAKSVIKE